MSIEAEAVSIQDQIKKKITENSVVLFMKGNAELPMCGFSARAVNLLKVSGATFATVDVLADEEIRQGIKVFSNWPTIPQLFVNGEFIGGSDIMAEMFESGELQELIAKTKK